MVRGYIIALFLILVRKQNFLLWVSKFDIAAAAAAGKSLQSCLTLCDPIDGSPPRLPRPWDSPGKNIGIGCHFLLQCMKVKSESEVAQSCPTLATPWTAAHQAPLSMGFSRQKYWSGVPLPSPKFDIRCKLFVDIIFQLEERVYWVFLSCRSVRVFQMHFLHQWLTFRFVIHNGFYFYHKIYLREFSFCNRKEKKKCDGHTQSSVALAIPQEFFSLIYIQRERERVIAIWRNLNTYIREWVRKSKSFNSESSGLVSWKDF